MRSQLGQAVSGKRVLLTGGSSGIGLAMARMLTDAGAHLFLVARNEERLEAVQKELAAFGQRPSIYPCDLSDRASVADLIETIHRDHGGVDILLNNAARSIRRPVSESYDRLHDFERTMALNYFAPIQLILGFLPGMRERQMGRVVNVLTMGVQFRTPRFAAYIASKAALDAATRCMTAEVREDGVAFTQVYLPLVRTPMIAPTEAYQKVQAMSPQRAAELCLQGVVTGEPHVYLPLGIIAELSHIFAPQMMLGFLSRVHEWNEGPPEGVKNAMRWMRRVRKSVRAFGQ